jgi:hypothetical protein
MAEVDTKVVEAASLEEEMDADVADCIAAALEEGATEAAGRPNFPPVRAADAMEGDSQIRRVAVPPHRMTPLRGAWTSIYKPIAEHMHLQVRMNVKTRHVEIRVRRRVGSGGGCAHAHVRAPTSAQPCFAH